MNQVTFEIDRNLIRFQNNYKIVATPNTDICIEKLLRLGPQTKKDFRQYELILFNLLNDVIKAAYKQGRNCLDD